MYTDASDSKHLHNELIKDKPNLLQQLEDIRRKVKAKLKGVRKKDPKKHQKTWRNHITKTVWVIRYLIIIEEYELDISFSITTSFDSLDGERHYLHLNEPNITLLRNGEEPIIQIFRSHFISRYKLHLKLDVTPYEVIVQFYLLDDFFKVQNFRQKKHWWLYLYKYGVAMVRLGEDCIYYYTFVLVKKLKDDQKDIIRQHIKEKEYHTQFILMLLLIENPDWREFFKEDDAILIMSQIPTELLNKILEMFNDMKRLRSKIS